MRKLLFVCMLVGACSQEATTQDNSLVRDIDPLFPDLAEADNKTILEYYDRYVSTPMRPTMEAWLRDNEIEVFQDSKGDTVVGFGPVHDPIAPGVVTFRELLKKDVDAALEISAAVWNERTREQYIDCVSEWQRRGGSMAAPFRWKGVMQIEAKGGVGRVADFTVPQNAWHPALDDQFMSCLRERYSGLQWRASRDYSYRLQDTGGVGCGRK